ncbi:hypothetical protein GW844_04005, partial [bacterium]|nr:hypothetical protein [bacterium]
MRTLWSNQPDQATSVQNQRPAQRSDEFSEDKTEWLKVIYLTAGDEIAIVEPSTLNVQRVVWDKIQSIEFVGYEQVYDIEVEGTHNFIANGILAHNTYISGNVGIGTTSPYSLLSISNSVSTAANTPLFTIASTTAGTATSTLLTVLANGNV